MKEEWKPVNFMNFGNYYEVSNLGNVRSLHSKNYHNIVASYANNTTGYMAVGLNADGFHKTVTVPRLVALAFIPQVEGKLYVNHKDENKHNNRVDNLEWCTQKYNVNYGSRADKFSNSMKGKLAVKNNPRYGKIGTMTGKHLTPEQRNKISVKSLGRIWVHKGTETKRIVKDELDKYMTNGYSLGRL